MLIAKILPVKTCKDLCVVQGTGAGKNADASSSKQAARATPMGSRSLQRSTGPFAYRLLCMLCAGDAENEKQPEFYVEPREGQNVVSM